MSSLELFSTDWRELWQGMESQEPLGAVFTRPEIVDLILDLAGYIPDAGPLSRRTIIEPSCGDGAFLESILDRLIKSEKLNGAKIDWRNAHMEGAIRAVDITPSALASARDLVHSRLVAAGCPHGRALELAELWTFHTDFLIEPWGATFDFVVGNPPYVRLEDLPKALLARYRGRFSTATDRADLYVPFIQRGLELLAPTGTLAFICANRFAKNRYGAALRRFVADTFHVRHFLNLEHTQPFRQEVSAYPAIIVIDRVRGKPTDAATLDNLEPATLSRVRREVSLPGPRRRLLSRFKEWYPDGSPWRTTSRSEHDFVANLEQRFPTLENSAPGTRVGIGVATGADAVFVLNAMHPGIEDSRQIPLLMPGDVRVEGLEWSGHYLVNPFAEDDGGSLVDLNAFPGLRRYLEDGARQLRGRHVAKARPRSWFRTIDRIWPELRFTPKLVVPDIQSGGVVALDAGHYYPHHNLYWIASDGWDLRVLQALLRSRFVLGQVRGYSVQMRGGSLRYQAQTLRRLRVPALADLSAELAGRLRSVATSPDQDLIDSVAAEGYGIDLPSW